MHDGIRCGFVALLSPACSAGITSVGGDTVATEFYVSAMVEQERLKSP